MRHATPRTVVTLVLSALGEPCLGQRPPTLLHAVRGDKYLYRAETRGGPRFVRLRFGPTASLVREQQALLRAPAGLAPALHHFRSGAELAGFGAPSALRFAGLGERPLAGVLISGLVPGTPLARPLDEPKLSALAHAWVALHRVLGADLAPLTFPATPRACFETLRGYVRRVRYDGLLDKHSALCLQQATEVLAPAMLKAPVSAVPSVLCHGDLRLQHVTQQRDGCRFLDFERAGAGDPAADLAIFACAVPLTLNEEHSLMCAYEQARKSIRSLAADHHLWERYRDLRTLWGLLRACVVICDLADDAAPPDRRAFLRRRVPHDLRAALARVLPSEAHKLAPRLIPFEGRAQ